LSQPRQALENHGNVHRLDLVASIESQEMPFQSYIEECSTELCITRMKKERV
jgi:hypothetical protein